MWSVLPLPAMDSELGHQFITCHMMHITPVGIRQLKKDVDNAEFKIFKNRSWLVECD